MVLVFVEIPPYREPFAFTLKYPYTGRPRILQVGANLYAYYGGPNGVDPLGLEEIRIPHGAPISDERVEDFVKYESEDEVIRAVTTKVERRNKSFRSVYMVQMG